VVTSRPWRRPISESADAPPSNGWHAEAAVGAVAPVDEKQEQVGELAQAHALVEGGDVKAAVREAERVRRVALRAEDILALNQVLALACLIRKQESGERQAEARKLDE